MDKATMKAVFQAHGLPIVDYTVVLRHEWRDHPATVTRRIKEVTGFPCFVKPSNLGSSVGISKVRKAAELPAALDEAARHDRKIVVERAVKNPREVEVSVLGNDAPEASLPGEITYDAEWYDYATKYAEGQAHITVPAPIGPRRTARVREIALAAFRAVDCAGMARVDFFLEDGRVILNEINTIPGFTATSAYARLWEATGIPYEDLVERLVALALERHRDTRPT
jgi:D-alanine-D-alanine ligase